MRTLHAKREAPRKKVVRTVIGRKRAAIFSHPMFSGNPKGDVTLVEFFDYQCGCCKRSLKPMKDLLASDRKLRVVWKEFPHPRAGLAVRREARTGHCPCGGFLPAWISRMRSGQVERM